MWNRIVLYFKGLKSEYNKIIFPSQNDIIRDSTIVIIFSVVIGLIIFLLDSIITFGFEFVLK